MFLLQLCAQFVSFFLYSSKKIKEENEKQHVSSEQSDVRDAEQSNLERLFNEQMVRKQSRLFCSLLHSLSLSFPTSSNSNHLLDDYNVSHLHIIIPLSKREREFSGLYTVISTSVLSLFSVFN